MSVWQLGPLCSQRCPRRTINAPHDNRVISNLTLYCSCRLELALGITLPTTNQMHIAGSGMLTLVRQEKLSLVFTFQYQVCYAPIAKPSLGHGLYSASV
jgi:hypothetical protein